MTYDELRDGVGERVRDLEYLFTPAISLLYILGLVKYRSTVDTFEYVGN
ncbi:ABC-three component system middle component 8 [Promicromonospora sp. NPDC023805]